MTTQSEKQEQKHNFALIVVTETNSLLVGKEAHLVFSQRAKVMCSILRTCTHTYIKLVSVWFDSPGCRMKNLLCVCPSIYCRSWGHQWSPTKSVSSGVTSPPVPHM